MKRRTLGNCYSNAKVFLIAELMARGSFTPGVITGDLMGLYHEDPGLKSETWGTLLCFPMQLVSLDLLCSGNGLCRAHLRRRLCLGQNSDKGIKIGGVDVTHGDDLEVARGRGLDRESRTHARQRNEVGTAGSLGNKDRDLMFVDGEQQQGRRLPFEISQVRAFEGRIRRKGLGIGKIEAERKAALEPGFDSVAIGRNDLRRRAAGESAEVLIEEFGREAIGLMNLLPPHERHGQQKGRSQAYPR